MYAFPAEKVQQADSIPEESESLQTTRSKESLIEFISAEKVAWDNLAAPLGDGFLPFPMGISTDFSTF